MNPSDFRTVTGMLFMLFLIAPGLVAILVVAIRVSLSYRAKLVDAISWAFENTWGLQIGAAVGVVAFFANLRIALDSVAPRDWMSHSGPSLTVASLVAATVAWAINWVRGQNAARVEEISWAIGERILDRFRASISARKPLGLYLVDTSVLRDPKTKIKDALVHRLSTLGQRRSDGNTPPEQISLGIRALKKAQTNEGMSMVLHTIIDGEDAADTRRSYELLLLALALHQEGVGASPIFCDDDQSLEAITPYGPRAILELQTWAQEIATHQQHSAHARN